MYSANGYTYPYIFDGALVADNFFYPQAGTNFLANVQLRF
jgi:iron complex outermembrane receptor protein